MKKKLVLGCMLVMLLAFSTSLTAVDYYVDGVLGNNSNSGLAAGGSAWATIQYAVDSVADPTTATIIHVSGDTYNLGSSISIDRSFTDLTIQGAGANSTIVDGVNSCRVFYIDGNDENVTLEAMKIQNGTAAYGGGIYNDVGNLNLTNCVVSGNTATSSGGGIYNNGGALVLNPDCLVLANNAAVSGGGIGSVGGTLTMTNCLVGTNTISGSSAGGGGLYANGTTTITNCSFYENSAPNSTGGGIYIYDSAPFVLTNSTVSGNDANASGGGIGTWNGLLTMTNCTMSGNETNKDNTSFGGGGLYTQGGQTTITNCTFANNSAPASNGGGIYQFTGFLFIKNTIIANNSDSGTADYYSNSGSVTNNGYNIVETQNGSNFVNGTNFCIVGPSTYNLSTTLANNSTNNGTETLALSSGSSAIDAGSNSVSNNGVNPPAQDQRGFGRNGATDIGAYEFRGDNPLPVTLSSFTVSYSNNSAVLAWTTQSETNNLGWNIYRSEINILEEAMQINLEIIPGAGTTSEPTEYIYEDESELMENTEYWYWLESIDYSGLTDNYGPISLVIPEEGEEPDSPEIPGIYGLHQNYPNPFNPSTEISFVMKQNCIGELSIYNVKGKMVRTLFSNKSIPKDELIRTSWNGKDETGKEVSTGVYYYKLRTTKGNFVRKMILLK